MSNDINNWEDNSIDSPDDSSPKAADDFFEALDRKVNEGILEQEDEPEGGPKATRYGREIEKKEKEYKKKKAEFKKLMAKLDKLEQF